MPTLSELFDECDEFQEDCDQQRLMRGAKVMALPHKYESYYDIGAERRRLLYELWVMYQSTQADIRYLVHLETYCKCKALDNICAKVRFGYPIQSCAMKMMYRKDVTMFMMACRVITKHEMYETPSLDDVAQEYLLYHFVDADATIDMDCLSPIAAEKYISGMVWQINRLTPPHERNSAKYMQFVPRPRTATCCIVLYPCMCESIKMLRREIAQKKKVCRKIDAHHSLLQRGHFAYNAPN